MMQWLKIIFFISVFYFFGCNNNVNEIPLDDNIAYIKNRLQYDSAEVTSIEKKVEGVPFDIKSIPFLYDVIILCDTDKMDRIKSELSSNKFSMYKGAIKKGGDIAWFNAMVFDKMERLDSVYNSLEQLSLSSCFLHETIRIKKMERFILFLGYDEDNELWRSYLKKN